MTPTSYNREATLMSFIVQPIIPKPGSTWNLTAALCLPQSFQIPIHCVGRVPSRGDGHEPAPAEGSGPTASRRCPAAGMLFPPAETVKPEHTVISI